MNSEALFNSQLTSNKQPRHLPWLFLIFSLAGFFDATYLTVEHFIGGVVPCTFGSCEKVLTSPYSLVFGIPVALLGGIYYLAFFCGTVAYLDSKNSAILKYLSYFSIAGLVASLWFIYTQLFLIKSICEFCMLSASTSTLLFIFGVVYLARNKAVV